MWPGMEITQPWGTWNPKNGEKPEDSARRSISIKRCAPARGIAEVFQPMDDHIDHIMYPLVN